ncbi:hypothetical protein CBS101457_005584 [Exobasidium rhododendri]|nr:hypothetical protein CBS101457_005584 [Exobasidium rhododendri]
MPLHGHCLCNSVKVTIDDAALPFKPIYCHCSVLLVSLVGVETASLPAVRSITHFLAAGTIIMMLDAEHVKVEGQRTTYDDDNTSNKAVIHRTFCTKCGTPIATYADRTPGKAIVKYGLFAQEQAGKYIAPVIEMYTSEQNSWETPVPGAEQIAGMMHL